jgi:chemotaxis protein MotB
MSLGRKNDDGNFPGGSVSTPERRDSFNSKSTAVKYASAKSSAGNAEFINSDELSQIESHDKDRYLITYADLITLLLGLFIILYAISNIDARKYEKVISAMGNIFGTEGKVVGLESNIINQELPSNNLKNELARLIREYNYHESIRFEENARGFTIHIMDDILFKSGSADLNNSSMSVLSKIATLLKDVENDIRIEGHTDNVPINTEAFKSNWHLSVGRALNTAYYLINNEGLKPEKISIVGYSEYKPIASNTTYDGRASNRRVDIVIIKN